jgi:gluconolactonase
MKRALRFLLSLAILVVAAMVSTGVSAEAPLLAAAGFDPQGKPDAVVDLMTAQGNELVRGEWRYSDIKIVATSFPKAGADGQPGMVAGETYDISPHAGAAGFDDSSWPVIQPSELSGRRAGGRLCFNWYRTSITIPAQAGNFPTAGSTVVFDTSLDDYAEIWVNGELPRTAGQSGGPVIAGWNASNRVVLSRNANPGQKIQLAIFGANGPLSNPPTNYIWMRHARLEFYKEGSPEPRANATAEVNVEVVRKNPAIDSVVPVNLKLYKLAEGFQFTEGPVWVGSGNYLLFSDPNANRIYKYTSGGALTVFRDPSGYSGSDIAEYKQPGSNGLALDPQGRLTINQHGNRRIVRLEADGKETVLADRFEGKRLNSPNDLVYRSDGALFFTDPPFGLPKFHEDRRRELPFEGVFSLYNGKLRLVSRDFTGPNGIAFSPDEKYLYVGNWDEKKKVVMRYEVHPDATLGNGTLFFDMTSAAGEAAIDGLKVDVKGNVYVSGPGGLWILSPEGTHLGTILTPMHPHNMAWGDADGQSLYLTAESGLYRLRLNIRGAGIRDGRVETSQR